MKKIAFAIVALLALSAAAVVSSRLATDDGGFAANHSQGVAIFPFSKLKTATSAKAIPFYTIAAAWPTRFVPNSVTFDAGCQWHTLTETSATGAPSGLSAGYPTNCIIDIPRTTVDAGNIQVFKEADGGYGLSLCPAVVALPTTGFTALCYRQAGTTP